MTSAPAASRRKIIELPHDPLQVDLVYTVATSLADGGAHGPRVERWNVTARLSDPFGLDHIPACAACLTPGPVQGQANTGPAVDGGVECLHRLSVGELVFYKVGWKAGTSPFCAMDETPELCDLARALFGEGDDFTEEFTQLVAMRPDNAGLLVFDRAELLQAWRGFGLGPIIAAEAIDRLAGGCGAVLVSPTPICDEIPSFEQLKHTTGRLQDTWERIGFVPCLDLPYLVLSTRWAAPGQHLAELRGELKALSARWRAAHRRPHA